MTESSKISLILTQSPSVAIIKERNREFIINFLVDIFLGQQTKVSSENIHMRLADYIDSLQLVEEEDIDIDVFDSCEMKAKKYVQKWTNKGYLTNYIDQNGEIFYELSSHTNKTIDWLSSLEKEEYVGAESKFKNIFGQLKELVEFTNDNVEARIEILERKKLEIEHQIQGLKIGNDIKVFEEFEIVPRFNQLNQSAKELLSDFKEVEDNFKEITKNIYQKHADESLTKSDILQFTFDSLDALKESQQGKSFYAFWQFLLNPDLQKEWENLTTELYKTLVEKDIKVSDFFLKGMKKHLHTSGLKVYKANDRMADKLSRIIRENEASKSELTKNVIQEIKRSLIAISKSKKRPEISFELETDFEISIPFERKLTYEQTEEKIYKGRPSLMSEDISSSEHLIKLFSQVNIDKDLLRKRVREILKIHSQTTIKDVIDSNGGLKKGLPELFGYITIAKEFKYSISAEKTQRIVFDTEGNKSIQVPEIILTK